MNEITLEDLPHYSPWPARLLGLTVRPLERPVRTQERVREEYGAKYKRLLDRYAWLTDGEEPVDHETIREYELAEGPDVVASIGRHLYAMPLREAMEESIAVLMHRLGPEVRLAGSVVDLGCGYGYLLSRLRNGTDVEVRGGEFVAEGVELANRLDPSLGVERFDFFHNLCEPLEKVTKPTVVTTSYTLHQLSSAKYAVELLSDYREKIAAVVNLEPEADHFGSGLLGLLRQRYGHHNGYSADLLRVLKARDDVVIDVVDPAVVGANALLPGTLTVWRFV